ncbi:MAG: DUF1819 family protein [Methylobacter sp.]|nr:DUF1819 family protein [Methylobacter sp.]MDP2100058.1 DUF1819 family protein [Methylobacter sp.]MDP2429608.1 DUF1819 family protein [Methylobacter sp.]MDP3056017.1 DUF1819 family protein [Methylobacter sp.]MDP3363619.1 DUF1819 family protein [Methylobacter sp.]
MNKDLELNKAKQYIRDLTGGSLLIEESRLVAETLLQALSEPEWNRLFIEENILKKKSQHTSIRYARAIRRRLEPLGKAFIEAVIHEPESSYKQLLMLSLMIHTPVLPDFMQHVVAETKRIYRSNLAPDAWESFLLDRSRILPGLNDLSESTLKKSGNNVIRALVEADYLDNNKNRRLQPVYLLPETRIWLQKLNREDLEPVMECTL